MALAWLFATLFGARFWFATLRRIVQVQGTETAPGAKFDL